VKANRIDYNMSDTSQKRTIVNSVIHTVEEAGGRFLEDDGADQWRVVDVKKVRRKVSQALRDSSMDSSINEVSKAKQKGKQSIGGRVTFVSR
jgi:hypothetical protein